MGRHPAGALAPRAGPLVTASRRRAGPRPGEADHLRNLNWQTFSISGLAHLWSADAAEECQTPSVRCEHEERSARAALAAVGRGEEGSGTQAQGEPSQVPHEPRGRFRNGALHVTLRLRHEVWNLRTRRCFRALRHAFEHGLRALRVPDHPFLGPGEPHPHDRRCARSAVACARDEGARGADGPRAEQGDRVAAGPCSPTATTRTCSGPRARRRMRCATCWRIRWSTRAAKAGQSLAASIPTARPRHRPMALRWWSSRCVGCCALAWNASRR